MQCPRRLEQVVTQSHWGFDLSMIEICVLGVVDPIVSVRLEGASEVLKPYFDNWWGISRKGFTSPSNKDALI